jgi:hypothetical protein
VSHICRCYRSLVFTRGPLVPAGRPSNMAEILQIQRPQPYRPISIDTKYNADHSLAGPFDDTIVDDFEVKRPLQAWYCELDREPASLELISLDSYDRMYWANRGRTSLPPNPPQRRTRWWNIRQYIPRTRWLRALMVIVLLQTIMYIAFAITIISQATAAKGSWAFSEPVSGCTQALTLAAEALYQLFLALDAGRRKNIIQIIGICVNNSSMLIMVVLSYYNTKYWSYPVIEKINYEYLELLIAVGACTALLACAAWLGSREFEWLVIWCSLRGSC